ncbi:MAG: NADH-quinone oxidoreductase subunit NuoN [Mariprofundaceae bacterium]|nr:NADH-quinone oxidoreductase subunit NuoN [Mariprofundaceae bacterium]
MANITFPYPYPEHLGIMMPEIILAVLAMALLLGDLCVPKEKKQWVAWAAVATCIVTLIALLQIPTAPAYTTFYGYFVLDDFAAYGKVLLLAATILGIFLSMDYMKDEVNIGEYYVLMLFALLGMMFMVSANNFVLLYLGLELMALSLYVLVAYQRDVLRSSEAALKYFILGSLSSGMLLYGLSFIYGVTGSFMFDGIAEGLAQAGSSSNIAVLLGMMFIIAGLSFKVSIAPFHMWTPDTYEGAPTPVTAFMSVAPKVAGFIIFIRVLADAFPSLQQEYTSVLIVLAILTIGVGNVAAIAQRNIKRMLAYSTVGHVGFVLLGLIAATQEGYSAALVYLTIYLFMNIGVFAIVILMRRDGIQGELLDDFAGLAKVRPGYALAMGLLLFSLAGIPFLAGFWAKFAVLTAVIDAGHIWLAVYAIVFSVVGCFYYLRLIKYMYFDDERVVFAFHESPVMQATIISTTLAVVVFGLYPAPVLAVCASVVTMF